MQLSAEDTRPVSAPAAPTLPLIRPQRDAPEADAFGSLQAGSTRSSHAGDRQVSQTTVLFADSIIQPVDYKLYVDYKTS